MENQRKSKLNQNLNINMNIIQIKVMNGPNYWSITNEKLIVLKVDFEDYPSHTNEIKGFADRLDDLFYYSLHASDYDNEKAFIKSVRNGSTLANVVEYFAMDLLKLAGMPCDFGITYPTEKKNIYHVIFSYTVEQVGTFAAESAVYITEALLEGKNYDLDWDIQRMKELKQRYKPSISTAALLNEAKKRGIPFNQGFNKRETIFGYGARQRKINGILTESTSLMGAEATSDKDLTKEILEKALIPVATGVIVRYEDEIKDSLEQVGYPVVVKPLDGNHGRGISIELNSEEEVFKAFDIAKEISDEVIIEKFITGLDYRILIVNNQYVSAIKRIAAHITGDGRSTIQELIDKENRSPKRVKNIGNVLTPILVDEVTLNILRKKKLSLQSVLEKGEVLYVKQIANVSAGAIPVDVTDDVHPLNIKLAERIARLFNLDICGIDFISSDLSVPYTKNNTCVIEVNASPGFKMHMDPAEGKPRDVAGAIMDYLFPDPKKIRIPIAAVTGTNGKTTVTRLIAHMVKTAGFKVGYTTTGGIYIDDLLLVEGDCAGPGSARVILKDPSVEFAVLECARGGILRNGLAFNHCDVGIVTNVSEDHIGMDDINTLDELAQVKAVVPKSVAPTGYAILNADDNFVYGMGDDLNCNIAYFSMDPKNDRIKDHSKKGGLSAVLEDGYITLYNGSTSIQIEKAEDIPITFSGTADFNIQNVLASVLFAFVSGFTTEVIKDSLQTFLPSKEHTPGRMNIFKFKKFEILADYAHNPAGIEAIGKFVKKHPAKWKVGIITAPGDRSEAQIIGIGNKAAEFFDEIIIRSDRDLRGRSEEEIHKLIIQGINEVNSDLSVNIVPDETEAIRFAAKRARRNTLITIFTEMVNQTLEELDKMQNEEEEGKKKMQKV
jgi:cyanophycin synthetase